VKIPSLLLGTATALVCVANAAVAQTPSQIQATAKAVTVEINLTQDKSVGSGVLLHQQGNLYTLITNRHVACGKKRNCTAPLSTETFQLNFGNGSSLKVPATAVKILGKDIDLATIQFRSNTSYQIARIAPPGSLKVGDIVYTSGYPAQPQGYSFNTGNAIAVVNKRLTDDRGGYTVVYNAQTQPGMSGGGVFDRNARLVAIHGQGERYRENTQLTDTSKAGGRITPRQKVGSKIGYNRGISARWVVESLARQGIKLGDSPQGTLRERDPVTPTPAAVNDTADEYFIAGFNKWVEPGSDIKAGKQQAIQAFTQAIRLNPRYEIAYFMRANTYNQLQEYRLALADWNQSIAIDPQFAEAYNNCGKLKDDKLNDPQGALADYNRAIALYPNYADAYINRGMLKALKLNDPQGALADYNRAIALNSQSAEAYNDRGNLKDDKLNDPQGALADYNRAITLDPQLVEAYNNRGILKAFKLKDPKGALADYNQAIDLSPQLSNSYFVRGFLKYTKLRDRSGGIADVKKAAELGKAQGNTLILNNSLQLLQSWGVK
jgi:tetratricopeptide (TPR) repeat protein